ncbi:SIR2 family protein [Mesorhizobium sp. M1156]|uniref:SIR2 family protein n=1 Tax=Mesorhizobium sp. M1156 TaxID=2957064 RepID=UPI003335084A
MSQQESVRILTRIFRATSGARPVLLLGAGASFSSGVPTAAESVKRLAKRVYAEQVLGGAVPPEQVRLTEWQTWLHDQLWYLKGDDRLAENFPLVVQHLLKPAEYRKQLLLDLIHPTNGIGKGYRRLAELVVKGLVSTILTTNFDTCLPAALGALRHHIGHIAEVNRQSGDLNEFSLYARAQIVWLHGRAEQYSDKNLVEEVQQLDPELVGKLTPLLADSPLVVIGYRGSEPSIMEHLLRDGAAQTNKFKNGVYWCVRKGETLHPNVEAFQRQIGSNFEALEIDGFDELLDQLSRGLKSEDRYLHAAAKGASASVAFDDQPVADVAVADLDHDLMIATLKEYCEKLGRPPVTTNTLPGLLREQGLLIQREGKEVPTTGCVLLFARDPQRWFPHAVISTSIGGKKRRVFDGNLITQHRNLIEWLGEKDANPVLKMKKRTTHDERPAYPERALVELLVNMLVHRDYGRSDPALITVSPGENVRFSNPGGLPDSVVAQLELDDGGRFKPRAEVSALRNRALCDIFFGIRAMERAGTGLVDVEHMLTDHGGETEFINDAPGERFTAVVRQPIASAGSKSVARDERPTEVYVLNFIPFVSIPDTISVARLTGPWRNRPTHLPIDEAGTFTVQGDQYVWSFAPLPMLLAVFGGYADKNASRAWRRSEIETDPDRRRVLSWLLRKHFERHLRNFALRGLILEEGKNRGRRAFFEGNSGGARCYVYDSPARKNIQRWVVKQRGPDGYKAWFENEGFGYEVTQMDGIWGIRIKPFYMFTGRDAKKPLPSFARTAKATRRIKLDRNQNVDNDLTFWGRFLSQGAQTINLGQQHVDDLILGGTFVSVEVIEEESGGAADQCPNPKAA